MIQFTPHFVEAAIALTIAFDILVLAAAALLFAKTAHILVSVLVNTSQVPVARAQATQIEREVKERAVVSRAARTDLTDGYSEEDIIAAARKPSNGKAHVDGYEGLANAEENERSGHAHPDSGPGTDGGMYVK